MKVVSVYGYGKTYGHVAQELNALAQVSITNVYNTFITRDTTQALYLPVGVNKRYLIYSVISTSSSSLYLEEIRLFEGAFYQFYTGTFKDLSNSLAGSSTFYLYYF